MTQNAHILIVDDDTRILSLLKQFLIKNGYLVTSAESVAEAEQYLEYFIFDLLMLDVMMPKVTGIEFAKTIRTNKLQVPIIMLTALAETEDRVKGLEAGADDYLTKPFEPRELLLRTQKMIELYGYKNKIDHSIHMGEVCYDLTTKILTKNGVIISLTSTEQRLLDIMLSQKAQTVSRSYLSEQMGSLNERSIDVQIVRLRNKIEANPKQPKFLQTVRNEGYILYL